MGFKKPSVTADVVVEDNGKVLLIQRKHWPYKDLWALPGGFLDVGKETVKETGKRELEEETGLIVELDDLELFYETSNPKRDERGHIVSLKYAAKKYRGVPKASDDAKDIRWGDLDNLPKLAFDHNYILSRYEIWKNKNGEK